MDKYNSYLKKLRELKNADKAKDTIKLLESIDAETSEPQKRQAAEQAIDLIEAELTNNDIRELLRLALQTKYIQDFGPWVIDFTDSMVIFELEGDKTWQSSYSISDGKVVFGDAIKVTQRTIWEPIMESKKDKNGQYNMFQKESITGDFIQLVEAGVSEDGTIPIKIIQPGWGSSGYYSEDVLQRDAGIYKEGTKMYFDHPTVSEEIERPERSLNDLAGVLVSEGAYNPEGAQGAGVYAKAKVFGQYQEAIAEMAPFIGLSHIALGTAKAGEAEGKSGVIIESLNVAESVDFVTQEGAGGQIVELFESARNNKPIKKMVEKKVENEELDQLKESNKTLADELKVMKEKALKVDASEFVTEHLKESQLPELAKAKLQESLSKNPIIEKGELDKIKFLESIKKAIEDEGKYLASLSESGKIIGMGDSGGEDDQDKIKESVKRSFERLGLEGKELEIAVSGR